MKLTKVDGISHYKKKEFGILKTDKKKKEKQNTHTAISEMTTKEIVEARFNAQIEGRIYNEFIRMNGKGKAYSVGLKDTVKDKEKNDIIEDGPKALFMLLVELYTGNKNDIWKESLSEINITDISNIEQEDNKGNKSKKYKLQYKLNAEKWLYKTEKEKEGIPFIKLLENVIKEKNLSGRDVRESESFKILKETFDKYKARKKEVIVKSIINNNIKIKLDETGKINGCNKKEKYFIELLNKIFNNIDDNILNEELELLFSSKVKVFLEKIKIIISEAEKNININIKKIVLNELRNYLKEKKTEEEKNNIGRLVYEEELKKYIETTFSKTKENGKNEGKPNSILYLNFLKKNLCIKNNVLDLNKFKKVIEENFKNRFTTHILDYGKLLYYKNDIDGNFENIKQFETKDLEYIKTKETLIRKLATMVSFSTYSFYNLHNHEENKLYFEDIINKYENICKKTLLPIENNSTFKFPPLNEKRVNYFFDGKNIVNKEEFVYEVYQSIYDIRNKVVHFKNEDMSEFKNNDEIKQFFKKEKKEAVSKLTEKFLSNNLEYYFSVEALKGYFSLYDYKILKTIIPFAPKFKRIIDKGERLYKAELKNQNKERYNWFLTNEINLKNTKEYLRSKNFLLSELYYNNFYSEFLGERESFKNAVDKARKRKEESGKNFIKDNNNLKYNDKKKSGTSYKDIEEYDINVPIEDYVANIHKLEMDRLQNEEKFDAEKSKETSHFLNEYIEDIFLEGFIMWLNKNNSLKLLLRELNEEVIKAEIENIKEKNKTNNNQKRNNVSKIMSKEFNNKIADQLEIIPDDKEVLRIYLFLNMNDSKRISEFNNEILKYEQFLRKRNIGEKKFLNIKTEVYRALCEFILLTKEKLSSEKTNEKNGIKENEVLFDRLYGDSAKYDELLKRFINEDILKADKENKEEQLYYQTNGVTPILYSTLENTRKFSTQDFISKVISKYTLEQKKEFDKLQLKNSDKTEIERIQEEKSFFHDKWKNNKKIKTTKFIEQNKKVYLEFLENIKSIRKYNYLKNKQGLQNVYEVHKIISDIQARNIAFINKYERDFKFFMTAIKSITTNNNYGIDDFLEPKERHFNISNYEKIIKNSPQLHQNLVEPLFNPNWNEGIRNYIAHFKHFTDYNKEQRSAHSFIEQMNYLINLFSYDKKVKNHINKSLKTILDKYSMKIEFEIVSEDNKNDYKIKNAIKSIVGKQLGETCIFEGQNKDKKEYIYNNVKKKKCDKDYCYYLLESEFMKDIKAVLEYKS